MAEISVREALAAGRTQVVLPAFVSIFGVIISIMAVMVLSPAPFFTGLCLTPLIVVIPAFIHCRNVTAWKIWAFESVRNVHDLNKKARNEGIIISWLESFSRLSRDEQLALERIRMKFSLADNFPQDLEIPDVFEAHYNKKYNLIEATLYFCAVAFASAGLFVAMAAGEGYFLIALLPWLLFVYLVYYNLSQYCAVKPPLIFSNEGIEIKSVFIHKSRIKDLTVNLNRKMTQLTASVVDSWADVTINIVDLEIPAEKLAEIAGVFKRRWKTDDQIKSGKDIEIERYMR